MWPSSSVVATILVCMVSAEKDTSFYLVPDGITRLQATEPVPHGEAYSKLLGAIASIEVDRRGSLHMTPEGFYEPLPQPKGPLKPNTKLSDNATQHFDFLSGPESIYKVGDILYAAASDAIYKVDMRSGEFKIVYNGRINCEPGEVCSRPFGLRVKEDRLLCADALQGLIEVNLTTGESRTVLANGDLLDGIPLSFPDDIDVDWENEIVYMSDGTTKWSLFEWPWLVVESDPSSRIIRVNLRSGKADVFAQSIRFANGVQISHDKKYLLVSEFSARRILKYPLNDPVPAVGVAFTGSLPGNPDNIRLSSTGGYWIAFPFARPDGKPLLFDELQARPAFTKRLGNSLLTFGEMASSLGTLLSDRKLLDLATELRTGKILEKGMRRAGMILELDANGNILQSLQSTKVGYLTEVLEHEGGLYVGSSRNKFVLSVPRANFRSA